MKVTEAKLILKAHLKELNELLIELKEDKEFSIRFETIKEITKTKIELGNLD